jgi:hypothetical protein
LEVIIMKSLFVRLAFVAIAIGMGVSLGGCFGDGCGPLGIICIG